jgi:hypothetical protein
MTIRVKPFRENAVEAARSLRQTYFRLGGGEVSTAEYLISSLSGTFDQVGESSINYAASEL